MSIVKVNWSGGKDSTCALLEHLKVGNKVKAVCYIPMFTNNIPLIQKDHYKFILRTAEYLEVFGVEIYIVHGITFWEYVTHISKKGKYKGMMFGFPYLKSGMCGFKRDSKLKALNTLDIGDYDFEDIGIAFDEERRKSQLSESKRSILCEHKITESDAKLICEEFGFLSPQYTKANRDGCVLCPNAKDDEIDQWLKDYPEAKELLIKLEDLVKSCRPDRDPPRRGYRWFTE